MSVGGDSKIVTSIIAIALYTSTMFLGDSEVVVCVTVTIRFEPWR